jgi:hypothetical protein
VEIFKTGCRVGCMAFCAKLGQTYPLNFAM